MIRRINKRLTRAIRNWYKITRYEQNWWWLDQSQLKGDLTIAELISPLRYDIVVRNDFLTFYLANQALYRTNFDRFFELALQHPYYICFQKMFSRPPGDEVQLKAAFAHKIKDFIALYSNIAEFGFDKSKPIVPKTGVKILPTRQGKKVSGKWFMGDGSHRLACLMALGYKTLPPDYIHVKCFPELSPVDGTAPLLHTASVDSQAYIEFLSLRYSSPYLFTSEAQLLHYIGEQKPEILDEVLSVIRLDKMALADGI